MRRARDAVQDVEVVDVVTDLPLVGAPDPAAAAAADAERAERTARRRARTLRIARRWWPVPLLAAAALVTSQLVVDARERDRVAARQEVPGVLRTVDPALVPTRQLRDDRFALSLTGLTVGDDLRLGFATGSWGDARELVALDRSGEPAWRASLDPPGGPEEATSLQFPSCVVDPSGDLLRCLVVDRDTSDALEDASGWQVDAPETARLLTLDGATGTTVGTRAVPPLSGWAGGDDMEVLASLTSGELRVSAWDAGRADPGTDAVDAEPLWQADVDLGDDADRLVYPPDLTVDGGRVVVRTDAGSWSLDAADGTLQARVDEYVGVSRTGYLATGTGTLLADDGSLLVTLPGQPVYLVVDDGGLPATEFVVTPGGSGSRRLTAVDLPSGEPRWSAPASGWTDGPLVLLDGVLYGTGADGAWAREAGTGTLVWRTEVPLSAELGSPALTDGRYLLALARPDALTRVGVTVAPAAGGTAPSRGARRASPGTARAVVALDLRTGRPAWATLLPADVRAVWGDGRDLVGWGDTDAVLLN